MKNNNQRNNNTKQYQIKKSKKARKNEDAENVKTNKKGKKKKHSKLKKVILVLFILMLIAILAGVGFVASIFFSDKWAITTEDLIANGNTLVVDSDEKKIATLSKVEGDGSSKIVTIDQMGKYTANAYIAIEDKRFYEHSGVDILRTAKATISYLLNRGGSSDVGGGSTITQQLVKNMMKDKADSGAEGIERKIREMSRAYQIESMLTKPQILEKYLNVIFVGGNDLRGVEYGAQYYFAKSAKDLDLAESAFLAGINHAPNMYNPYDTENDHKELIANRTKLVLSFMKEQNRISDDPEEAEKLYNEAVAKVEKGLTFKKGKFDIGNMTYFVQEALREAAQDLADAKDIDYDAALDMIKSGGYTLHTTQDSAIQKILLKEMAKDTYVEKRTATVKDKKGKSKKVTYRTNAGMTIIDHSNGHIVALAGDLQQDDALLNTNYATSTSRQTGSSIKPLANVAPGLEEKVITAATVYNDAPTKFPTITTAVKNVGYSYCGLCTVRLSIERSSNIVNLKIMSNVGIGTSIKYLNEFGLTTYNKDQDGLTLAIGGTYHSSSTVQMAGAYAALANGGVYIEPTFYTKLTDSNGKTVVESHQETRRVISEANAFIVSDILTDVVTGAYGTAGPCAISGMDVAAKTGTTDIMADKWLCGYTPYYAAATWYGYGNTNGWPVQKVNNARTIWANVMSSIHKSKKLPGKRFKKPSGVVTARVCKQTGKLATSACSSTYTEYFATGTVPKACTGHTAVTICKESKKIANQYCPETEKKYYGAKPEKEQNPKWTTSGGGSSAPKETCTIHNEETSKITIVNVVGKTEAEARTLFAGLTVQVIYEQHSDQADSIVLKQSIAEGTKVDKGVTIVLTVNKQSTNTPSSGTTQTPSSGSGSAGSGTTGSGSTSGSGASSGGSASGGTTSGGSQSPAGSGGTTSGTGSGSTSGSGTTSGGNTAGGTAAGGSQSSGTNTGTIAP